MAVTHLDCHSTYFYSSTHLHKTKIYLMLFASGPQITKYCLLQTWKYWLKLKLEEDIGSHSFLNPFCEWLITGMSESPLHGEEAALNKHGHIWYSSIFLLVLKHTTLLGCSKVDQVTEFKPSNSFSKPQDSVSSSNKFIKVTFVYLLPLCITYLQKTFLNSTKRRIINQYLLVHAVSNIGWSVQKIYVIGDKISFDSAFLRFFNLQVVFCPSQKRIHTYTFPVFFS